MWRNPSYIPIKRIGSGYQSTVWLATDVETKNRVTIKVTDLSHVQGTKFVEHLRHEQNTLQMLSNEISRPPNAAIPSLYRFPKSCLRIAKLIKVFSETKHGFWFADEDLEAATTVFFVFEYIRGETLNKHIAMLKGLTEDTAKFFAAELVQIIGALHERGVVYRDLKASNVIVTPNGRVLLIDFGFAKHIGPRGRTRSFCGTPHAMPPEIAMKDSNAAANQYGFSTNKLLSTSSPLQANDNQNRLVTLSNDSLEQQQQQLLGVSQTCFGYPTKGPAIARAGATAGLAATPLPASKEDVSLLDDGEFTVSSTVHERRNSVESINDDFGISSISPSNSIIHGCCSSGSLVSLGEVSLQASTTRQSFRYGSDSSSASLSSATSLVSMEKEQKSNTGFTVMDQEKELQQQLRIGNGDKLSSHTTNSSSSSNLPKLRNWSCSVLQLLDHQYCNRESSSAAAAVESNLSNFPSSSNLSSPQTIKTTATAADEENNLNKQRQQQEQQEGRHHLLNGSESPAGQRSALSGTEPAAPAGPGLLYTFPSIKIYQASLAAAAECMPRLKSTTIMMKSITASASAPNVAGLELGHSKVFLLPTDFYGVEVDWWSLGVLIYEMLFGQPPFGFRDYSVDRYSTIKQLSLNSPQSIKFPERPGISDECKDIIMNLLQADRRNRLGVLHDAAAVRNHKWFHGIEWDQLHQNPEYKGTGVQIFTFPESV